MRYGSPGCAGYEPLDNLTEIHSDGGPAIPAPGR